MCCHSALPGTGPVQLDTGKGTQTGKFSNWQKMTSKIKHETVQSSGYALGLLSHMEATQV